MQSFSMYSTGPVNQHQSQVRESLDNLNLQLVQEPILLMSPSVVHGARSTRKRPSSFPQMTSRQGKLSSTSGCSRMDQAPLQKSRVLIKNAVGQDIYL